MNFYSVLYKKRGGELRLTFGERLVKAREDAGYNQKQLANVLGITPTRLNYWEKDKREPDVYNIKQIASALNISADYLIGNDTVSTPIPICLLEKEQEHIKKYRSLDSYGKEAVDGLLDTEHRRCSEKLKSDSEKKTPDPDNAVYIISYFHSPMSAGTGLVAGEDGPEDLELTKRPPCGTSYVAPVSGNSMEPTYYDGDKLFIRAQEDIHIGQIGIFFMDGKQWIKELGDGVLLSHNPDYDPTPIREDIKCQGVVLGICDKSYFK